MTGPTSTSAVNELVATPAYRQLCRFQLQDPYPLLEQLRENDPVHWSPELQAWLVTKFDLVQQCLRTAGLANDRTAINMRAVQEPLRRRYGSLQVHISNWLGFTDPPKHTRMREVGRRILSPDRVKQQLPMVNSSLQAQLEELRAKEALDVVTDVALPLPLTVICQLLGVPAEDMTTFHRWSASIAGFAGIMNPLPDDPSMHVVVESANAAWAEAQDYFIACLADRARSPADDGLTTIAAARGRGELTDEEALGLCVFILAAGLGTTVGLLGNAIFLLLRHAEALQQLVQSPELTGPAVEEVLRYEGPIATASRLAAQDLEIADRPIRRGDAVILHLAAADRDPVAFNNPANFDITRSPNRHVAFGWGSHFCLGAPLARLQAAAVLGALVKADVLPRWRLDGRPAWRLGRPDARELQELKVSWLA